MKILNIILRYLFSWIDAITAKLITTVYRLLTNLSELVLYSDDMIKVIGRRIGLILGIFMLFRLAISLVNYMISPDKINDGKQGGGKLIVNVGISLALLISINFIFKEAYRIQGVVVNSRIIEKIFFGNTGIVQSNNDNEDDSVKMDIGYYLYTGFIYPNTDVFGDTCDNLWDTRFDITKKEPGHDQSCEEMLHDKLTDDARKSIYRAKNTLDMSYVFKEYDLISSSSTYKDVLDFDYTPIVSNAAGIVVLLVLISFSMDLATRAVKLLFLQIVAPVPIISFMDTGKGQDIFKKWGKECINTYLSVFIRLIAINFAVFMIVLIRGNYKNVFVNNVWLNIFLIIGCLMFAKQVPHLIEEFLGIKLNGMSLKPLKKLEEQSLFGKQIVSTGKKVGGLATGAAIGGVAAGAGILTGQGFHTAAFTTALKNGFKGEKLGKNFSGSYNAVRARHTQLRDMKLDDVKPSMVTKDKLRDFFGAETRSAKVQRLANQGKAMDAAFEKIKNQLVACDKTDGAFTYEYEDMFKKKHSSNRSAKTIAKELDEVRKTSVSRENYSDDPIGEAQYKAAIKEQRERVALMEAELEGRINAATAKIREGKYKTGTDAADKVIVEQADVMIDIKNASNKLGTSLDKDGYEEITATDDNIVLMMKQGKNISSQAASGKLQTLADVGKYTSSGKK